MTRELALERYNELPLPSTSDEHWRFTDLRGFDPDSYGRNGHAEGQSPDTSMLDIDVAGLLRRVQAGGVREVIVATNPNTEGEATAMYLARLINPLGVRVTRLASGLPVGGDLEYADEVTMTRAMEGRRDL